MKMEERNIYDLIMIVYFTNDDTYSVVNIQNINNLITIWNVKDLQTAKAVRKAYCDGYIDRKLEENNNGR